MLPFAFGLRWPAHYLPPLGNSGTFPMTVPGCNRTYQGPTVALHLHDYQGDFWVARQRYHLEPGDLTLSPPNVPSRYDLHQSGTHLCIHFLPPASPVLGPTVRLPLHLRLGPQTAALRERLWRTIDHARQAGGKADSPAACAASASLQELLLWLHGQIRRGKKAASRTSLVEEGLVKLNQAIDASLDQPLLIGDLTEKTGLSTDYISRLFAQRYGMKLQHYILLRRIELARHLLLSSDLPVAEIGQQSGIPNPQYFNKQFRRIVGQSPLAYRQQQMAKPKSRRRKVPRLVRLKHL